MSVWIDTHCHLDAAEFGDAGARVVSVLDYSGMAGQAYAADSARKVREVEDLMLQHTESTP